ncbi:MAG: hypothetical protein MUC58_08475 [Rhizobiaceae bacterium]|nr:hypothetical protein [Rhizobiaceae bacterium]
MAGQATGKAEFFTPFAALVEQGAGAAPHVRFGKGDKCVKRSQGSRRHKIGLRQPLNHGFDPGLMHGNRQAEFTCDMPQECAFLADRFNQMHIEARCVTQGDGGHQPRQPAAGSKINDHTCVSRMGRHLQTVFDVAGAEPLKR